MASKKDLYEVLGLTKSATTDEIKKAYRSLAKKYHPDNQDTGDEAKFKEVQEAYDVLTDEKKKQLYDQYGFAGIDPQAAGGAGGPGGFGGFGGADFGGVDLNDIFSSVFGGFGGRRSSRQANNGPRKGQDRFMKMNIDFMDSIFGKATEFKVDLDCKCEKCNGLGAQPNDFKTCSQCNGSGRVIQVANSFFGQVREEVICPTCGGKGKVITKPCDGCNGQGYNSKKTTVELNIPAGIQSHQQLKLKGKGSRGLNGGDNGDLYVEILVKEHSYFKRDGDDIHISIPISFADAALGCKIDVPTVYGDVEVRIPEGIQSGQQLRIKGKGVKNISSPSIVGDEYIHIDVKTPTKLSKEQKELLEKYRLSEKDDSVFSRFKKLFK